MCACVDMYVSVYVYIDVPQTASAVRGSNVFEKKAFRSLLPTPSPFIPLSAPIAPTVKTQQKLTKPLRNHEELHGFLWFPMVSYNIT